MITLDEDNFIMGDKMLFFFILFACNDQHFAMVQNSTSNYMVNSSTNWDVVSQAVLDHGVLTTTIRATIDSKRSGTMKRKHSDKKSKPRNRVECPPHCRCQIWKRLIYVDCSTGSWKSIPATLSPTIQGLNMSTNRIRNVMPQIMSQFVELLILDLSRNYIRLLHDHVFENLHRLKQLVLSENQLTVIDINTFRGLELLQKLDVSGNGQCDVSPKILLPFKNMSELKADRFTFCCDKNLEINSCDTPHDTFSSCQYLVQYTVLRCIIWVFAVLIASANMIGFILRCIRVTSIFNPSSLLALNLCMADGMFSVYLFTVAVADSLFAGEYYKRDLWWRHSSWCKMAGVIFTISSEMSVFLLAVITLERIYSVVRVRGSNRCMHTLTYCACIFGWLVSTLFAVLPCLPIPYFRGFPDFYSRTGMCLPLHLTQHKVAGWEYSVVLFMGLNGLSLIIVDVGSAVLFYLGTKAIRKHASKDKLLAEIRLAQRLVCVMLTDAACWTPVIILTALALAEVSIPLEVYNWAAILVMPINATINPILYTFLSGYVQIKPSNSWCRLTMVPPRKAAVRRHRCSSLPDIMTVDNFYQEHKTELDGGISFIEVRRSLAEELKDSTHLTLGDIHTLMMELNQQVIEMESEKKYIPEVTLDTVLIETRKDPTTVGSMENINLNDHDKPIQTEKHFRLKEACAPDAQDDVIREPSFAEERMSEILDMVAVLVAKFGYNT